MDNDTRFIIFGGLALITGIVLGTGLGMLLAPQSGARTRRQLRNMVEDATERVGEFADDAKDTMNDVVERGRKFVVTGK
ncbi:MAG: YtxH domain-containing protein [Nitrospirota bacterium]|nr:MAG: YtxH domain-containing protein [Nitrospirota bacterium]